MQTPTARDKALENLRLLLRDLFKVRESGARQDRFARAHGYTDGFMRALIATGVASQSELQELVNEEREKFSGPALRIVGVTNVDDPQAS